MSSVTSCPRAARKLTNSEPSRPVEKFVSRRTTSSGSYVGPAVTTQRIGMEDNESIGPLSIPPKAGSHDSAFPFIRAIRVIRGYSSGVSSDRTPTRDHAHQL